ncbi:MAG: hypothetical protein QXX41_10810 [Nitrososphaerota archaeon]
MVLLKECNRDKKGSHPDVKCGGEIDYGLAKVEFEYWSDISLQYIGELRIKGTRTLRIGLFADGALLE